MKSDEENEMGIGGKTLSGTLAEHGEIKKSIFSLTDIEALDMLGETEVLVRCLETNKADSRRDIEEKVKGINPNAFGAILIIKHSKDLGRDDAEAAVDEVCRRLPPKVFVTWSASSGEDMSGDGMEVKCFVGYKKMEEDIAGEG